MIIPFFIDVVFEPRLKRATEIYIEVLAALCSLNLLLHSWQYLAKPIETIVFAYTAVQAGILLFVSVLLFIKHLSIFHLYVYHV